jgi:hypothetical protein
MLKLMNMFFRFRRGHPSIVPTVAEEVGSQMTMRLDMNGNEVKK